MSQTVIMLSAAVALIVAATLRFTAAGISSTRVLSLVRRRRSSALSHLRQAAEIARLNSELQASSSQSAGLAWRVMEVAEIVDESADCRSFYLVDPYRQPLPDFRPGQYLMVRSAIAGANQTTRCYSLSSSPNERFWRITVKRQEIDGEESRQPQKGGLSIWLHRTISEGDCLLIGGPSGQFYLPEDSARPLVLMAAGVGITPMASMLRWSLENTPDRPVTLLYQCKDLEHWPLGASLHGWQNDFPSCRVRSFFSRVEEPELQTVEARFPGKFETGKFDSRHAAASKYYRDCDYYMCGPDGWMNSLKEGLVDAGVPAEQVHWESFGGTGAQPSESQTVSGEIVPVRFEHSDVDAEWTDGEQTLWELARESQVEIPSGCLSGVCGCCRVKLLAGDVEYDRSIAVDLAEDECLTCVARPKSPVVIDA